MYPNDSLSHSQEPTHCLFPQAYRFSPWPSSQFFTTHFNIILPSIPRFSRKSLSFTFAHQILYTSLPKVCYIRHQSLSSCEQNSTLDLLTLHYQSNVQSVRINDLNNFTFRHFSFVSDAIKNWTPDLYLTRWRHLQILNCFYLSQHFFLINLITLSWLWIITMPLSLYTWNSFLCYAFFIKLISTKKRRPTRF